MKTYDISIPITPDMPVWPGDPAVSLERVSKIEDGQNANVTHTSLSAHTGTHVDAPYHFLQAGDTLEKVPLKVLMGRVYVLHLPDIDLITADILRQAGIPPRTRRLLFKTRNSETWARGEKEFQTDFVALAPDAAQYLVDRGIKLVGIDYLSIAPFRESRPTHEILLRAGIVILEGVDLSEVSEGRYTLYCLPLNLQGVDGAPARAILVGV
jgi:arylformamidase